MTLPEKERLWAFSLPGREGDPKVKAAFTALADEMSSRIKATLERPPLYWLKMTRVLFPRRALIVERTDGRHCWLSAGKKQQFTVGPSGWVNLYAGHCCQALCGERPLVFRPSPGALVTCLLCLANGVPPHLR